MARLAQKLSNRNHWNELDLHGSPFWGDILTGRRQDVQLKGVDDACGEKLGRVLRGRNFVSSLDLELSCSVKEDRHWDAVFSYISVSPALASLRVILHPRCPASSLFTYRFLDAASRNHNLKTFVLSNMVTAYNVRRFLESLPRMHSLKKLHLSVRDNDLVFTRPFVALRQSVLLACKNNTTLEEIRVHSPEITEEDECYLRSIGERNKMAHRLVEAGPIAEVPTYVHKCETLHDVVFRWLVDSNGLAMLNQSAQSIALL
jgi:hypothetical protein